MKNALSLIDNLSLDEVKTYLFDKYKYNISTKDLLIILFENNITITLLSSNDLAYTQNNSSQPLTITIFPVYEEDDCLPESSIEATDDAKHMGNKTLENGKRYKIITPESQAPIGSVDFIDGDTKKHALYLLDDPSLRPPLTIDYDEDLNSEGDVYNILRWQCIASDRIETPFLQVSRSELDNLINSKLSVSINVPTSSPKNVKQPPLLKIESENNTDDQTDYLENEEQVRKILHHKTLTSFLRIIGGLAYEYIDHEESKKTGSLVGIEKIQRLIHLQGFKISDTTLRTWVRLALEERKEPAKK